MLCFGGVGFKGQEGVSVFQFLIWSCFLYVFASLGFYVLDCVFWVVGREWEEAGSGRLPFCGLALLLVCWITLALPQRS